MNLENILYNAYLEASMLEDGMTVYVIKVTNQLDTYFKVERPDGWIMEVEFPDEPYELIAEYAEEEWSNDPTI
ncbi:MAG: hypothetical protein ACRCZZ_05455 [Phocaeicola sp.]